MKLPADLDWLLPVAVRVFKERGAWAGFTVDDLVQIGAVAALEADATYNPQGNTLKTWRWDKAEWAMRNAVTHAARRHKLAPMEPLEAWSGDDDPDGAPGPDMRYLLRKCAQALARLPGPQRQLLSWRYADERTYACIAREQGSARLTVRNAEKAALQALHEGMIGA